MAVTQKLTSPVTFSSGSDGAKLYQAVSNPMRKILLVTIPQASLAHLLVEHPQADGSNVRMLDDLVVRWTAVNSANRNTSSRLIDEFAYAMIAASIIL